MKILFLPQNYFPSVSGVPVVVRYLAEGLLKRGHDVAVATARFKDTPLRDNVNGVKVYRFDMWKDWKHCYRGDTSGFVKFVIDYRADVNILECSECITTDLLLPHLHELSGKNIFHSHGFSGLEGKPFALKGSLFHTIGNSVNWLCSQYYFRYTLKKTMPSFASTMCLSEVDSSRDYLKKYSRKSYILDNAADDAFFDMANCERETLSKYVALENHRFMVSCANYTFIKNQQELIRQYYASEESKHCSLVCIGSLPTEFYHKCQELVATLESQHGHRDVHLLHGIDRADIPAIINKAWLYLVSSRYEQYSISIIEAMSQGVPFVSTNVGNARVLPGGITIDTGADMHKAIDLLASDEDLYNRYSKAGKEFAYTNCRIDAVVNKLEGIIFEAVN